MQLVYWMQLHKYLEILATIEHEMSMLGENQIDIEMDWEEIKNDSSFYHQSFESYAFQFDETDITIETNKDGNDSFLENLANLNKH